MAQQLTGSHPPLIDALWPARGIPAPLRAAVLAVVGSLLIAASAKVQVPLWPVPITMQTFAVLVISMAYGRRLGAATLLLYLAEGAVGLPVFARGGGLAYFAGPTAGYLIGYPLAAALVGWLGERGWDGTVPRTAAAMLLGNALIYVPGLLWLATFTGVAGAFEVGLLPFLLGDALKLALAAGVLPFARKLVRRYTA